MSITFITGYFFITTMMLIYNTYKDIKTMEIDSRYNFMAIGATMMLLAYFQTSFITLIVVSIVVSITMLIFNYKKFFASGDIEAMSWVMFALGIFSYGKMIIFLILMTLFYSFNLVMLRLIKSHQKRVPAYCMILGSWLITLITFFFY